MHIAIQRDGDYIQVAGAFAISEKRAFDAICPGEQPEFRGGDSGVTVVVRMQANDQ